MSHTKSHTPRYHDVTLVGTFIQLIRIGRNTRVSIIVLCVCSCYKGSQPHWRARKCVCMCETYRVTSYSMLPRCADWYQTLDLFSILHTHAVQVHSTQCALSNTQLPWWFQIEVTEILGSTDSESGDHPQQEGDDAGGSGSNSGTRRVGRFSIPRRKHELFLCNNDSVSTCVKAWGNGRFLLLNYNWFKGLEGWTVNI